MNPDTVRRRTFLAGTMSAMGLAAMGVASSQADTTERACLWCGPDDPGVEDGNHVWIDTSGDYSEFYTRFQGDTGWGEPLQLATSDYWEPDADNRLVQLPDHEGIDVSRADVTDLRASNLVSESGAFTIPAATQDTITQSFNNVYRHAAPDAGIDVTGGLTGNVQDDWAGWVRDADGNITGMDIAYRNETTGDVTGVWSVFGVSE